MLGRDCTAELDEKRVAASSMLAPGVSVAEAVNEWHCNADVPVVFGNTIAALGRQDWR